MLSTVFLYLVSVLFSLSLPLILFNHEPIRTLRMPLIDIAKMLKLLKQSQRYGLVSWVRCGT